MDEVADGSEDWDHEALVKELETMNDDNSKMLLQYQKWITKFIGAGEKPKKVLKTSTRTSSLYQ